MPEECRFCKEPVEPSRLDNFGYCSEECRCLDGVVEAPWDEFEEYPTSIIL